MFTRTVHITSDISDNVAWCGKWIRFHRWNTLENANCKECLTIESRHYDAAYCPVCDVS